MRNRVVLAVLLSFTGGVRASAQVPAGGEFQVNTYTTSYQWASSAAADPNGGFIVLWTSAGQDGSGLGVFARRYDAAGAARGPEFQVNTYAAGNQSSSSVAVDTAGNFVVAWMSDGQDGSAAGIFARRFNRDGLPQASEFQVNTYTTGGQGGPVVAFDSARNLMVAWTGAGEGDAAGLFAQRFDASGAPHGSEFRVNEGLLYEPRAPVLVAAGTGRVIIAWYDGAGGIRVRRYGESGLPLGSEFQANPPEQFNIVTPSPGLTADFAGNFVVTWSQFTYQPPLRGPLAPRGLVAARYYETGTPRDSIMVTTQWNRWTPVAADAAGDFVVGWEEPYGTEMFANRFDGSGIARGSLFALNVLPARNEPTRVLVSDSVGNLVAAWTNNGQDGSANGVFARRFGGVVPATMAVDTAASASDGNRVLEAGESVDVRPAWRNVNGAPQALAGVGLAFTGPAASGVSYVLQDGAGSYGTVADGASAPCADCYRVAVGSGTRPAQHWDATFTERLTPDTQGQTTRWSMHVGESFGDVPRASLYYRHIETLLHRGVTAGCGAAAYCPASPVTREQMAAFVLLAREGSGYRPPACALPNLFADVSETSPFCDVIEELARRGVVGGCGGGFYCPTVAVTREQMPVFVLRTLDPALIPPDCTTPLFSDVPASNVFCRWIEELARRGVVGGCGGGFYCPAAPVTREQMAVFLSGTFGLTLYGP